MSNEEKKLNETVFLAALVGREVTATLLDGGELQGVFVTNDRFHLFLKVDDQVYMLYKHSIKYIVPLKSRGQLEG